MSVARHRRIHISHGHPLPRRNAMHGLHQRGAVGQQQCLAPSHRFGLRMHVLGKRTPDRYGHNIFQPISLENGDWVLRSFPARKSWPRSDHTDVAARHVGYQQGQHRCGADMVQQPAALHPRQALAHGVDLLDRCARTQQHFCYRSLLLQRNAIDRRDHQRRRAAGEQHDHAVTLGQPFNRPQHFGGGFHPLRVRNRMPRLKLSDAREQLIMTVFDDDAAVRNPFSQQRFQPLRERPHGLSRADHNEATI